MAGILTDAEKASMDATFKGVMDTFLRPIQVYQEASVTVLNTDPNWNPFTDYNQNATTPQVTPIVTTISGRILWDKTQEWDFLTPGVGAQLKIKDQTSRAVRIKVDYSGHSLLKTAKKVELDGVLLDRTTEPRPHGLFGTGFWTYYYVRST